MQSGGLAQTLFSGVCDLPKGLALPFQPISEKSILSGSVPFYKRIYSPGELQFITTQGPETSRRRAAGLIL